VKDSQRKNNICITGLGVVSAFGNTLESFREGIYRNKSEADKITDVHILKNIEIPVIKSRFEQSENRLLAMSTEAILSAIKDRGKELAGDKSRCCLIVGSGMGLADQYYHNKDFKGYNFLASDLSRNTGLHCDAVYIGNSCAAGSQAISYGMDLIRLGKYDIVVAGGVDILSQAAYAGFLRLNAIDLQCCRPFDKKRKGISIGEGAVFFVIEKENKESGEPNKHDGRIYCTLLGSGVTCDAFHTVQMDPEGRGAIKAMEQAVLSSGIGKEEVGLIIAHGTGTEQNDRIESYIINEYFGEYAKDIYITAPKGAIGHTGGASGAFGVLTAICAITEKEGIIPPICNLTEPAPECDINVVMNCGIISAFSLDTVMVNAFAFGGTNVVIICGKRVV